MEAWIVIIVLQLALICAIAALEGWALHLKEEGQITFSRLMFRMFEKYPWTRKLVGAIIVGIGIFDAWALVHIVFGPCAFGICR